MTDQLPNSEIFSVVEETIERRLSALDLSPKRGVRSVDTGYTKFEIHRLETQIITVPTKDNPDVHEIYYASLETLSKLEHPAFGSANILDLITLRGNSQVDALERCANTYMDVIFPALQSLFEGKPAPGNTRIGLSTVTSGKLIGWEVFTGQLQMLNDENDWLANRLATPPLNLVLHTLTGYLSQPKLHWCKLFGQFSETTGLSFGCSIDGQKSPEAEAEMQSKFGEMDNPSRLHWEFRQFIVMRPTAEVDEEIATQLRKMESEDALQSETKPWWKRIGTRKNQ